jgi:8-oxo-dGTP pyrophosphatase MutT (NUDIX family)
METEMFPDKACPVVLTSSPPIRILLFRHPLAGTQLVKGTIEKGETPGQAALRELTEESGISDVWSFHLCRAERDLPERWGYKTLDDHGHLFEFFWASLEDLPYADCHPVFQRALKFLCERLKASGQWGD